MKILDVPQSGSLAGQTSSRNRFGQYRRTRAIPVNPNTTSQQARRATFAAASAQWRTLTPEQQAAWEAYAAATPRVNSLGATILLTGAQSFVAVLGSLAAAGLSAVTVPPPLGVPDSPIITVASLNDDPTMSIAFTPTPLPDDGTTLMFEASRPLSPGVSFNKDFRIVAGFNGDEGSPAVLQTPYQAIFGVQPAGAKIFFRAWFITPAGARSGFGTTAGIVES